MKLITNKAELTKAIASIASRGKKLDGDIQIAAMSVCCHAHQHGDVTLLNQLYNAMPRGARASALTLFLVRFGPVVASTDPTTKREQPFVFDKNKKMTGETLTALIDESGEPENHWYMLAPAPAPDEVFDFVKAMHSLMNRVARAEKDGKAVRGAELMSSVKAQVEAYDKDHPPAAMTLAEAAANA